MDSRHFHQQQPATLSHQGIPLARLLLPAECLRPFADYTSDADYLAEAASLATDQGFDAGDAIAIALGIADGESGREQSLEEYVAQTRTERQARRKQTPHGRANWQKRNKDSHERPSH